MHFLALMRHGKSSWDDMGVSDIDRPLNARGRKACRLMAGHLSGIDAIPGLVLCSVSARTRESLDIMLQSWQEARQATQPKIHYDKQLYLATPQDISEIIGLYAGANPGELSSILVLGHNPGMASFAHQLAREATARSPQRAEEFLEFFPTAAMARFEGQIHESGFRPTRFLSFDKPRLLEQIYA